MVSAGRRLVGGRPRAVPVTLLLYAVLGPPVAWSVHFGTVYFVVAVACGAGRAGVLLPMALATIAAVAVSASAGVVARRRWVRAGEGAEAEAMRLFLAIGMLGAAFFTGLILLEALPPLFVPACPAGEG